MHTLFRTCVAASALSVLFVFVASNTALALTTRGYCIVIFTVPFTNKVFEFPSWTFLMPTLVGAVSTVVALSLWGALFVKRWRKRIQVGDANV